jgi:hypothetical protein
MDLGMRQLLPKICGLVLGEITALSPMTGNQSRVTEYLILGLSVMLR